jgi:L-lactate dehydrogenase
MIKQNKIVIIGAGHVGSHCAQALAMQELCGEIVLTDIDKDKAAAQAEDIVDALVYPGRSVVVRSGNLEECADAAIIIVAVGRPRKPGQTRLDMLEDSIRMIHALTEQLNFIGIGGIVITITNPADIVADYVRRRLKLERNRVFGTGTLLDTARMIRILAKECRVSPCTIQGYVLGEHGDSSMIAFSQVRIGGLDCEAYNVDKEQILEKTRSIGMDIIRGKLSTEFGIAQACAQLCRCIMKDEKRVMPLSVLLDGEYGQRGFHAGVPCLVGQGGAESVIRLSLTPGEKALFDASCKTIWQHRDKALSIVPLKTRWRG